MSMLVTIEEAAAHLRIDDYSSEVNDLTLKIQAASGTVLDELEMDIDDFGDSDSDGREIPFQVKAATLLVLGDLYRYRDSGCPDYKDGNLPPFVKSLLFPLKTWGLESD